MTDRTAGTLTLALALADNMTLTRMGFGAMRLSGPGIWGPPRDRAAAVAVLRRVVELGLTHIDTSDFYGPHVTNEIIKEALHPYPDQLRIVTKVGARRDEKKAWLPAVSPEELVAAVHDNIDHLGVDALDVVNMRMHDGTAEESIAEHVGVLARLQEQGLIRNIGVSNVTAAQLAEAQQYATIVCVQNLYNLANRDDDALIDSCATQGIAYVPFFPLGGFAPLQSSILDGVAARLGVSSMQVALAWLLQRSANIALIPGTSSVAHLEENIAASTVELPADALAELDAIAG